MERKIALGRRFRGAPQAKRPTKADWPTRQLGGAERQATQLGGSKTTPTTIDEDAICATATVACSAKLRTSDANLSSLKANLKRAPLSGEGGLLAEARIETNYTKLAHLALMRLAIILARWRRLAVAATVNQLSVIQAGEAAQVGRQQLRQALKWPAETQAAARDSKPR